MDKEAPCRIATINRVSGLTAFSSTRPRSSTRCWRQRLR